jgi:hypothetical protein
MSKFLLVYHGGGMPESAEEQAKMMAAWGAWFGQLGSAVLDGGNPTGASVTVSAGGTSDGGGANPASGYSLIEASSLEDATEKAKGCPIVAGGGSVEVCATIDVGV